MPLYFSLQLSFLFGGFLHYMYHWKQDWILYGTVFLTTYLNCVFNCGNSVCSSGWLQCVQSNWLYTTFADSRSSLPFLLGYSLSRLHRKSSRFLQVLIWFLSSELKVFPYSILLYYYYYYYARSNWMKWTLHCDAVMTSSSHYRLNIVEYSLLFPLLKSVKIHQEIGEW